MEPFTRSLESLDDQLLAYLELKKDLLFHRIPSDKIYYYVTRSLEIGRKKAQSFLHKDIKSLCKQNQLEIEISDSIGVFHQVKFRAEIIFTKKKSKIKIYKPSLVELIEAYNLISETELTYQDVLSIHLAHEFYHYLEYREKQFTNELLDKVDALKIGPYKKKSTVVSCSEIAAHSFCKELIGIDFLPNLFDSIYLVHKNMWTVQDFENHFRKTKKEWEQVLHLAHVS
ncbi:MULTISPECIES: hypothetical protein [Bacillus]|uniref:Uncharacterized protein n=2 Tax=Bacillus TaxID=1386 RepID=A0A0M4FH85_9BACI|nr:MULTISPECIES: hypothetical protein [Bacillus]ALC80367.1 hypothetical protein AM592_01190 [Bacillus gobiensis]MBP1083786.1 hypothetical protein [Bacillus capparidis]MED1098271.1 hypothetical protein [Bacillus capparidis]